MDLSSNVCGLCCSVESRRFLQPIVCGENPDKLESGGLLCARCDRVLDTCREFRDSCRRNLTKVRMIKEEDWRQGPDTPDSTSVSSVKTETAVEPFPVKREDLDTSGEVETDCTKTKRREKAAKWRKSLYQGSSPDDIARLNNYREANRLRNARYRERRRTAIEEEKHLQIDISPGQGGEPREEETEEEPVKIHVTPDVSLVMDEEYRQYQDEEQEEEEPGGPTYPATSLLPGATTCCWGRCPGSWPRPATSCTSPQWRGRRLDTRGTAGLPPRHPGTPSR